MRFMVEIDAGMEKANAVDAAGGTGPDARISELMYALTWGTGGEPKFTPILSESFDDIIAKAKSLVSPPQSVRPGRVRPGPRGRTQEQERKSYA